MDERIEHAIDHILARLAADGMTPQSRGEVNFSVYADDATLSALRPQETWKRGAAEHRAAMEYAAAVVRRKYPNVAVNLVELELGEYNRWLRSQGLADDESTRAAFVASKKGGAR